MDNVDVIVLISSLRDRAGETSRQHCRGLDLGWPGKVKHRICE